MKRLFIHIMCLLLTAMFFNAGAQLPNLFDAPQRYSEVDNDPVLNSNTKPDEVMKKNLFIKVTANKTTCFVGEPVMVQYELYQGFHSQCKVSKMPSFTNSSVIEMSADEPAHLQKEGNKYYHVYVIRKVQLLPLQEGDINAGTASVDGDVNFVSTGNQFKVTTYSTTINSAPVNIHVKPLPETGKPKNFAGVVGNFHIKASVDSNASPSGENNNLHISVEGSGNFAAISLPEVTWPKGTEHFDASDSQHIDKYDFPVSGNASFDVPFIGTKTGSIIIPAISFSFFNPAANKYETVQTAAIPVNITPAISKNALLNSVAAADVNRFNYIWIVPVIAAAVACIWLISYKANNKKTIKQPVAAPQAVTPSQPAIQPQPVYKTDFENEIQTLQNIIDDHEFFVRTQSLLMIALQENLEIRPVSHHNFLETLRTHDNASPVLTQAEFIMNACNQSLYSPYVKEGLREVVSQQLQEVFKKLNLIPLAV